MIRDEIDQEHFSGGHATKHLGVVFLHAGCRSGRISKPRTMNLVLVTLMTGVAHALRPALAPLLRPFLVFGSLLVVQYPGRKGDVYSVLWVLVFGFATLNILGLVARRFEPDRSRLSFGEVLAVLVVMVSISLLGWELLNLLHIFPIKLSPR